MTFIEALNKYRYIYIKDKYDDKYYYLDENFQVCQMKCPGLIEYTLEKDFIETKNTFPSVEDMKLSKWEKFDKSIIGTKTKDPSEYKGMTFPTLRESAILYNDIWQTETEWYDDYYHCWHPKYID